jgi:hypothetical protein
VATVLEKLSELGLDESKSREVVELIEKHRHHLCGLTAFDTIDVVPTCKDISVCTSCSNTFTWSCRKIAKAICDAANKNQAGFAAWHGKLSYSKEPPVAVQSSTHPFNQAAQLLMKACRNGPAGLRNKFAVKFLAWSIHSSCSREVVKRDHHMHLVVAFGRGSHSGLAETVRTCVEEAGLMCSTLAEIDLVAGTRYSSNPGLRFSASPTQTDVYRQLSYIFTGMDRRISTSRWKPYGVYTCGFQLPRHRTSVRTRPSTTSRFRMCAYADDVGAFVIQLENYEKAVALIKAGKNPRTLEVSDG